MNIGMESEQDLSRHNALIAQLSQVVGELLVENQDNPSGLVEVLRLLERLHRGITEGAFQEALPQNRQELYKLMRIIEEEGGWPHIPKMKLNLFCANLLADSSHD